MHMRKTKSPEEKENLNACDRRREISEETLEAAKGGDQEAFEKLYESSYPRVSVTVKSVIRDQDSAQDVIQEVYLKAFRELKKLKSSAGFSAWIGRIAHNCAVNEAKKRKDIPLSELEDPGFAGTEPEDGDADHLPLKAVEHGEQKEEIRRVLNLLPPEQREVATLYYLEYFSVREITEYLGIPQNTVKSRLYYARRKLRDSVEELEKQGISLRSLPPFAFLAALLSGEKAEAASAASNKKTPQMAGGGVTAGGKAGIMKMVAAFTAISMVLGLTYSFFRKEGERTPDYAYMEETESTEEETESETEEETEDETESEVSYANGMEACLSRVFSEEEKEENESCLPYLLYNDIENSEVHTITFLDQMDMAPEDAQDVSAAQDGSVVAWGVGTEDGLYDVYIAASGAVLAPENCAYMFSNMTNLTAIDFGDSFDTSQVTSMYYMFSDCPSLEELDLSSFDTSKVTTMESMFGNCSSLKNIVLDSFDTSSVTTMESMFYGCSSLESVDVSGFDTSKVETFFGMFAYCSSFTEIDISNFNTSSSTIFWQMFCGCESLRELDLTNFDTRNAEDMGEMFTLCYGLESLDVSSFDTSNVTSMSGMFFHCDSLSELDLRNFDTAKVEDMSYMFSYCTSLEQVEITEFRVNSLTDISYMFNETPEVLKDAFRDWMDTVKTADAAKELPRYLPDSIEAPKELEAQGVFGIE